MRQGELIDITDDRDLFNTTESYSFDYFLFDKKLLMPIVNLDIIDKSVLENETRVRIEFAYLILTDVDEISWIGEIDKKGIIGGVTLNSLDSQMIDWFMNYKENGGYELKIKYDRLLIYIPIISNFGQEWWTPWDTPNFKKNIEKQSLDNFAMLNLLANSVCSELKMNADSKQKLEFTIGTKEQMSLIRKNWAE